MEPVHWAGALWGSKVVWLHSLLWVSVILVGEIIELTNKLSRGLKRHSVWPAFKKDVQIPVSQTAVCSPCGNTETFRLDEVLLCGGGGGWGQCPGLGHEVLPCPALPMVLSSQPILQTHFVLSKSKRRS